MTTAAAMGEHPTDLRRIPPRASLRYTQRWSKKRLDQLRLVGDDLGDRVAAELHSKHGGLTKIHDLLTTVRAKAAVEAGDCSSIFRCFLEGAAVIPAWANREMVERGQRVHAVHLPFMGLSLFSGSLVGGAQFVTAATVTALAGNITTDPLRRINETGLLLAALAFPGSLMDAGSEAHDSLTRVRLLHSALRHWLPRSGRLASHRERVPEQVYVEGEVPINQQDLAITLGVFCYINLRSLRRMGILLSAWDIQCYVHMWRYAGHVLGILDELLPTTLEEQEEFMLCSMLHQGAPEAINGPKTKEFIAAFAKDACRQTRGALPAKAVQTFLNQMTRYLNGSDYVTGMEIEDLGDWHWSVQLIYLLGFVFGTAVPRIPLGEEALFRLHTRNLRRQLRLRGTPTGHGAGSGAGTPPSRL
eukprot:TRINITY_DN23586_c0_g1_i4.p1 TRINITY_DN23586_c0_g1~~TRINITY_DN23586_c0_g1_i4.p1  ORF type:complete len:416 (-),score=61.61 TRINITY_DN23586_c0_g1_i4:70-1317(-)